MVRVRLLTDIIISLRCSRVIAVLGCSGLHGGYRVAVLAELTMVTYLNSSGLITGWLEIGLSVYTLVGSCVLIDRLRLAAEGGLTCRLLIILAVSIENFVCLDANYL